MDESPHSLTALWDAWPHLTKVERMQRREEIVALAEPLGLSLGQRDLPWHDPSPRYVLLVDDVPDMDGAVYSAHVQLEELLRRGVEREQGRNV